MKNTESERYMYITKPTVCKFDVTLHETLHPTFRPLLFENRSPTFEPLVTSNQNNAEKLNRAHYERRCSTKSDNGGKEEDLDRSS